MVVRGGQGSVGAALLRYVFKYMKYVVYLNNLAQPYAEAEGLVGVVG